MPSFIVHSVAGSLLQKHLKLDEQDQKRFFVGNLLPDSRNISIDPNWTDLEQRKNIQDEKRITHFRKNFTDTFEYPDIEYFLSKYEKDCKTNIVALAYLFHIYTDYYYFKYFLPTVVESLDKNMQKAQIKKDTVYIKIDKTKEVMLKQDFWSKTKKEGLYQEYTRLNKYLIKKYNFSCNCKELLEFLENNTFEANINEINSKNGSQVIEKLATLLKETEECEDYKLKIFEEDKVDKFIDEVINTFLDKYSCLLNEYKN